nr:MAG TPA: hypothetical protein [Caudoviricetes sp.]
MNFSKSQLLFFHFSDFSIKFCNDFCVLMCVLVC